MSLLGIHWKAGKFSVLLSDGKTVREHDGFWYGPWTLHREGPSELLSVHTNAVWVLSCSGTAVIRGDSPAVRDAVSEFEKLPIQWQQPYEELQLELKSLSPLISSMCRQIQMKYQHV